MIFGSCNGRSGDCGGDRACVVMVVALVVGVMMAVVTICSCRVDYRDFNHSIVILVINIIVVVTAVFVAVVVVFVVVVILLVRHDLLYDDAI
jgi:hypothetical protein